MRSLNKWKPLLQPKWFSSLCTLITILTETMDFSREVGGVVVKIVKIIEGLEDEL